MAKRDEQSYRCRTCKNGVAQPLLHLCPHCGAGAFEPETQATHFRCMRCRQSKPVDQFRVWIGSAVREFWNCSHCRALKRDHVQAHGALDDHSIPWPLD